MAEVKKKEEELTTADLASYSIPPEQTEGLKLVKGQEPETLDRVAAVSEPLPLFSESEMGDFRSQWSSLQTGFVDEPRRTVEDADKLVAAVMQRLYPKFPALGLSVARVRRAALAECHSSPVRPA